ncbi:MAG: alpha/beta hydrolase [Marinifilaceae bacterium]|jgi:fermentation-respiration switch protein FrsA (DUF1100 family)|nr:alpha/beta hydrolase [Marinifilaceae bacterium]
MKNLVIIGALLFTLFSCESDKKELNPKVLINSNKTMEKVQFASHETSLVGNLYYPENYVKGKAYPAIIVTGAWTTVKEQMPNLYAEKLAKRGFITMTFDFRGWGESAGDFRYVEDPIKKTEDIVAAANYLRTLPEVAENKVAGLGICASSGYMVKAYTENAIDAAAIAAPWLHNDEIVRVVYGGDTKDIQPLLDMGDAAQKKYDETGESTIMVAASSTDKNSLMFQAPYYTEPDRGLIAAYDNKFNVASWRPWLTFDAIQYADKLPGQILFVESEGMALPQGSAAFKAIAGDKVESVNLPGVSQFDFYDQAEPVEKTVDSVSSFMEKELK